ncbi:putative transporter small subunit [Zobellella maritima]|nr:putative transporter small subunit [Zobellella maritima]
MSELAMAAYILIWPTVSALVLVVILGAIIKDVRSAKREHRGLV